MGEIAELLRRAARVRADAPRSDAMGAPEREAEPVRGGAPRPEAQPHHANYEALMRSHDRVRTRHLPVQGGEDRA